MRSRGPTAPSPFENLVEAYDTGGQWMLEHLFPNEVAAPGDVGATVPATLSLTLGGRRASAR